MTLEKLIADYGIKKLINGNTRITSKGWVFSNEENAVNYLAAVSKNVRGYFYGLTLEKGKWVGILATGKKTRRTSFYKALKAVSEGKK